jgi:hypothetical protein
MKFDLSGPENVWVSRAVLNLQALTLFYYAIVNFKIYPFLPEQKSQNLHNPL